MDAAESCARMGALEGDKTMLRIVFFSVALAFTSCFSVNAKTGFNYSSYNAYGNIYVFDDMPNVAWLIGKIRKDDYYNLRQVIRGHEIQVLVLDSPGGALYESLQMAATVHDRGIDTYVPRNTVCASACANIFFAGASRFINGDVGVHQFSSNVDQVDEETVQLTVADIIGFLNEFNTPGIVFEKMFQSPEMFYFSNKDFEKIARVSSGAPVIESISSIEEHIVEIYEELGLEAPSEPPKKLTDAELDSILNGDRMSFDAREQSSEIYLTCNDREDIAIGQGTTELLGSDRITFSFVATHGEYKGYHISGNFDFGLLEPIPETKVNGTKRYYANYGVVAFRKTSHDLPKYFGLRDGLREEFENKIYWIFSIAEEGKEFDLFDLEDAVCVLVLNREK